jgi:hypothetical protein
VERKPGLFEDRTGEDIHHLQEHSMIPFRIHAYKLKIAEAFSNETDMRPSGHMPP